MLLNQEIKKNGAEKKKEILMLKMATILRDVNLHRTNYQMITVFGIIW